MQRLIEILKEKKYTLSCAESLTCGMFASTIGNYPGVSKVFKGGVVTYCSNSKVEVINVPQSVVDDFGVVSKECAASMAHGVRKLFKSDVSISFTGNAGPDVLEGKPVGLVYIGICINKISFTFECQFEGTRNEIRQQCINEGINKLLELI